VLKNGSYEAEHKTAVVKVQTVVTKAQMKMSSFGYQYRPHAGFLTHYFTTLLSKIASIAGITVDEKQASAR
jgi:hypothetical protein